MVLLRYLPKKHFWPLDEGGSIRTAQLAYVFNPSDNCAFLELEKKKKVDHVGMYHLNDSSGYFNFSYDEGYI